MNNLWNAFRIFTSGPKSRYLREIQKVILISIIIHEHIDNDRIRKDDTMSQEEYNINMIDYILLL